MQEVWNPPPPPPKPSDLKNPYSPQLDATLSSTVVWRISLDCKRTTCILQVSWMQSCICEPQILLLLLSYYHQCDNTPAKSTLNFHCLCSCYIPSCNNLVLCPVTL